MKVGDRVVCIVAGQWYNKHHQKTDGPNKGEITRIRGFSQDGGLLFEEYREDNEGFSPRAFRKLDEDFADNVLSSIEEQIKEAPVRRVKELEEVPA